MLRRAARNVARPASSKKPAQPSSPANAPKPPKPTSSIIDHIYDVYLPTELSKVKSASIQPYITPNSPFVKTPQEIKGVYSPFVQHAYEYCAAYTAPVLHRCRLFDGTYYPPWHIISVGRKSRPAIFFIHRGEKYNGNEPEIKQTADDLNSKVPTDYAVWRNYVRRQYRNVFFDVFNADRTNVDGVYQLKTIVVPEGGEDLVEMQSELEVFMKKAQRQYNQPMPWVAKTNSKVKKEILKDKLRAMFLPEFQMYSRDEWVS